MPATQQYGCGTRFLWPNPTTRPFDTKTDTDPDPELASPEPVRKGANLQTMVADLSDQSDRNRYRNRDRSLFWLAPAPRGPL
ncbi:MAG: hypothetical protein ACOX52_02275 [Verrucomicrobiota bacterium]